MIHPTSRPGRTFAASLLALGLLISAAAASPLLGWRHISLVSSVPAKDSHVTTVPTEIRFTFSGTVDVTKAGAELLGAGNKAVELEALRAVADSPRVAVAKIRGSLPAGTYTVKWNAIAADGAEGAGTFGFMFMPK